MSIQNELLSLYDKRYLEHYAELIADLHAIRESWTETPRFVEIGSHRAAFLVGQARIHSPKSVLGIEWRGKYHRLALERIQSDQKDDETNVFLINADAKLAIPILFPLHSVEAFFVTFPDPWWKVRHAQRRLLTPIFMRILARRLVHRGRLYLKSDVFEYLHRVRAFAEISEAFRPLPADHWPDETPWTLTTRERKCRNEAIPYGNGYYLKRDDFNSTLPQEPENSSDYAIEIPSDPESIVRGVPLSDKKARDRRNLASRKS